MRKNVFLWIVPAQVGGRWRATVALPAGERSYEIELKQKFQEIDGLVRYDKKVAGLWNAKLCGDRINFVIVDDSGSVETNLYFDGRSRVTRSKARSSAALAATSRRSRGEQPELPAAS